MDPSQIVDRFFREVWNQRRFVVLDEIVDPGCVTHQVRCAPGAITSSARGPVALQEHIQGWLTAFPDIRVTTDLRYIGGAHVVSWETLRYIQGDPRQGVLAIG